MEYRSFLARNAEHLIAGIHLWFWIYYDLTSIFPLKAPPIGSNSMILNSTSHGMVCTMRSSLFFVYQNQT